MAYGYGLPDTRSVYVEGGDLIRLRRMQREGLVARVGDSYKITDNGLARLVETDKPIKRRKPK